MKSLHIFTVADEGGLVLPSLRFVIRTHHVVKWEGAGIEWFTSAEELQAMVYIVAAAYQQGKQSIGKDVLLPPLLLAVNLCHGLSTGPYCRRDGGPYAMLIPDEHFTLKGLQKYLEPQMKNRQLWGEARILADNLSGLKRHLPK